MSVHLDPRYLEVLQRVVDAAEDEFDRYARKLTPLADAIRKQAFLISALYSVRHEYEGHPGPDHEPLRKLRILSQDMTDFHAMMSSIAEYKPICPRCQDETGVHPDSSFFRS